LIFSVNINVHLKGEVICFLWWSADV